MEGPLILIASIHNYSSLEVVRWSSRWTIPAWGGRQAGWGDLVGGAVIVLRRCETGEHFVGEVPIQLFRCDAFGLKLYLDEAAELVLRGLGSLGASMEEPIHICQGYILSKARRMLAERGFRVETFRIVGETQEMAEREFIRSLSRLGMGGEEDIRRMRSFRGFLRWVLEDPEKREIYVKTGWPSWPRLKGGAGLSP